MAPEITSRPETATQIILLIRFVVLCTLALAAVLLLADFLGRGWSTSDLRFLSEKVVIAFVPLPPLPDPLPVVNKPPGVPPNGSPAGFAPSALQTICLFAGNAGEGVHVRTVLPPLHTSVV